MWDKTPEYAGNFLLAAGIAAKPGGLSGRRRILDALLAELAGICALWAHADPLFTFVLLGLLPAAVALAALPPRFFPAWSRALLRLAAGIALLVWFLSRLRQAPADVAVVELTAGLLFPLLLTPTPRAHSLAFLLTLILVGYGGLLPNRPLYLGATMLYIFFTLLGFYLTRTQALAGGSGPMAVSRGNPRDARRVGLLRAAVHAIAVLGLWYAVAAAVPPPWRGTPGRGRVPVSFQAWQTFQAPRFWRRWLRPRRSSPGAGDAARTTRHGSSVPGTPPANRLSRRSWLDKNAVSARQVVGRGAAGRDLVFRVRCEYKLYWLARLYDDYDGNRWYTSRALARAWTLAPGGNGAAAAGPGAVYQSFEIEKAVSARLFSAYRFLNFAGNGFVCRPEEEGNYRIFRDAAGPFFLHNRRPTPPWQYDCISLLARPPESAQAAAAEKAGSPPRAWNDPLPRRHYLALPRARVSPRIYQLAEKITAGKNAPLQRAEALRDWLRTHCRYTLKPPALPAEADPVEFFLFVTREGYCLHFAEALTILARCAGLPARLAAGYAPGNYNLLTGQFEVYEYQAHAWSQIYISPYGWLTFDGVPPSQLPIRTTPSLLARFHDPFGKDWSARPPELAAARRLAEAESAATQQTAPQNGDAGNTAAGSMTDLMSTVYKRADALARGAAPGALELTLAAGTVAWERLRTMVRTLRRRCSLWLQQLAAGTWDGFRRAAAALRRGATRWRWPLGLAAVAAAILLLQGRRLRRILRRGRRILRCRRLAKMLQNPGTDLPAPDQVRLAAELVAELLFLHGLVRSPSMDFGEFARAVYRRRPQWGREARAVSAVFTRVLFAPQPPSTAEIEQAVRAALRLWQRLGARPVHASGSR